MDSKKLRGFIDRWSTEIAVTLFIANILAWIAALGTEKYNDSRIKDHDESIKSLYQITVKKEAFEEFKNDVKEIKADMRATRNNTDTLKLNQKIMQFQFSEHVKTK